MLTELNLMLAPYGKDTNNNPHLPNPTQQRVLDWVDRVRAGNHPRPGIPVLYLQGGVGSGKTRALLAPTLEELTQVNGIRILWGRQDFNDLKLSAMETFFEVLPDEIVEKKNEAYHWCDVAQPEGGKGRIYFSGLKDLSGLGSQEYGLIIVTEVHEISLKAYRTIKQRARQSNMPTMILMEGNPPNKGHWIESLTTPTHPEFDPDIEMWKVDTRENWENLPKAYRYSLDQMPKSWKSKYLRGDFGFTPDGDPFYQGFREALHKRSLSYNTQRPLMRSWDYGYHHPACSIHQIDVKGRWLVLKEVMGTDVTIDRFGDYVKTLCNEWFPNATWLDYGDPAGNQKTDKSEKTSVEILASMGVFVTSKSSTYRERKEIVERKLATLIDGLPALLVDEGCRTIVDGFLGGYHYPVRKENQAFNPALFEVPFRDGYYEHLMNTMEYFAVNTFTGAETKDDIGEMTYKVIGPMKDVKWDWDEETTNYNVYKQATRMGA